LHVSPNEELIGFHSQTGHERAVGIFNNDVNHNELQFPEADHPLSANTLRHDNSCTGGTAPSHEMKWKITSPSQSVISCSLDLVGKIPILAAHGGLPRAPVNNHGVLLRRLIATRGAVAAHAHVLPRAYVPHSEYRNFGEIPQSGCTVVFELPLKFDRVSRTTWQE